MKNICVVEDFRANDLKLLLVTTLILLDLLVKAGSSRKILVVRAGLSRGI